VSGSYAIFWVETPSDIETDQNILMYYGNSGASSVSNGSNTFLFFDDFSGSSLDSSKWDQMNSGTGSITVNGGTITIASGGDWWDTADTSRAIVSKTSFSYNYITETYVIGYGQDSYNRFFGLRSSSATNAKVFVLLVDSDRSHVTNVYRDSAGGSANWYGENSGVANPGNNKIGRFDRAGDTVYSYYDGSLTNSRTVAGWDLTYVSLTDTYGEGNPTEFDWIRVRKYVPTVPSWNTFGSEKDKGGLISWSTFTTDTLSPWSWSFIFPNGTGYYQFYSIGKKSGSSDEAPPGSPDAICYYEFFEDAPVIHTYALSNSTGSKLNNLTGALDVNKEYCFSVNITDSNGWANIEYINITSWYDFGDDGTTYNQTVGGNLNFFLQYQNTTGTGQFLILWPDDEVQLIEANCTQNIVDADTRIINISFKLGSQARWANSNNTWDTSPNTMNDDYSWNFEICVTDQNGLSASVVDEYGVYKYSSILPDQNWVDVIASPGFDDTSNVVTITYASNYDFNISIYFEENLTNGTYGTSISITNNVYILADTDLNDDITTDVVFEGIGEANALHIFNDSGVFSTNNTYQTVDVQFKVYIPFGTHGGTYVAHVAIKIKQD
ncbi:MAG: DUF2341 domain-containing protein, partial [Euryarchaeota archaeon]|nr:DUF2341 domain-containing protein [Euryarchaeota archaeon]